MCTSTRNSEKLCILHIGQQESHSYKSLPQSTTENMSKFVEYFSPISAVVMEVVQQVTLLLCSGSFQLKSTNTRPLNVCACAYIEIHLLKFMNSQVDSRFGMQNHVVYTNYIE